MSFTVSIYMFRPLLSPPSECSTVQMQRVQQKSRKMNNRVLHDSVCINKMRKVNRFTPRHIHITENGQNL
jgi:hypothetical protein